METPQAIKVNKDKPNSIQKSDSMKNRRFSPLQDSAAVVFHLLGLPQQQIAEILGFNQSSVNKRLRNAPNKNLNIPVELTIQLHEIYGILSNSIDVHRKLLSIPFADEQADGTYRFRDDVDAKQLGIIQKAAAQVIENTIGYLQKRKTSLDVADRENEGRLAASVLSGAIRDLEGLKNRKGEIDAEYQVLLGNTETVIQGNAEETLQLSESPPDSPIHENSAINSNLNNKTNQNTPIPAGQDDLTDKSISALPITIDKLSLKHTDNNKHLQDSPNKAPDSRTIESIQQGIAYNKATKQGSSSSSAEPIQQGDTALTQQGSDVAHDDSDDLSQVAQADDDTAINSDLSQDRMGVSDRREREKGSSYSLPAIADKIPKKKKLTKSPDSTQSSDSTVKRRYGRRAKQAPKRGSERKNGKQD
jgi:hypothetical protein